MTRSLYAIPATLCLAATVVTAQAPAGDKPASNPPATQQPAGQPPAGQQPSPGQAHDLFTVVAATIVDGGWEQDHVRRLRQAGYVNRNVGSREC